MIPGEPIQVAVFERPRTAERAVDALLDAGVAPERVQVVSPTAPDHAFDAVEVLPRAGESAASFALAGGSVGTLVAGLLAAAGTVATGGSGLVALGPIVGAAAAGGATGSFLGLMSTRGLAPEIADYHDQALRRDQTAVGVEPAESAGQPTLDAARRILVDHGGVPRRLPEAS